MQIQKKLTWIIHFREAMGVYGKSSMTIKRLEIQSKKMLEEHVANYASFIWHLIQLRTRNLI
jgi:hypothetical protein